MSASQQEPSNFVEDIKIIRNAAKYLPCMCAALTENRQNHPDCLQHNAIHALRRIEKRISHEIDRRLSKKELVYKTDSITIRYIKP